MCRNSTGLIIENARLQLGNDNIRLYGCDNAQMSYIEAINPSGGGVAGGIAVLINQSDNVILQDFSVQIDLQKVATSDNIYDSGNVTIRRGVVNSNTSNRWDKFSGIGNQGSVVIDTNSHDVLVEDVDVINPVNICFATWGRGGTNSNITFRRTRCGGNTCAPLYMSSGEIWIPISWGWTMHPGTSGVNNIFNSVYTSICVPMRTALTYDVLSAPTDIKNETFIARTPIEARYCAQ